MNRKVLSKVFWRLKYIIYFIIQKLNLLHGQCQDFVCVIVKSRHHVVRWSVWKTEKINLKQIKMWKEYLEVDKNFIILERRRWYNALSDSRVLTTNVFQRETSTRKNSSNNTCKISRYILKSWSKTGKPPKRSDCKGKMKIAPMKSFTASNDL